MRRTSRQSGEWGSSRALAGTYVSSFGVLVSVLAASAWLASHVLPTIAPSASESKMVRVRGGPLDAESANGPVTIRVRALDVWRGEVSVSAYLACVLAGSCERPGGADALGECNYTHPDRLDRPMNCVSVKEAIDFCKWEDARLPTSNEWRYLALGGSGAEPAGVRDLNGGVAEWACNVDPENEEVDDVVCWTFAKMGERAGARVEPALDRADAGAVGGVGDAGADVGGAVGAGQEARPRQREGPFYWRDGHRSAGTGFRCVR